MTTSPEMFRILNCTLEYIGPKPETLEEAWAITLEKWRMLAEEELVRSGGSTTCGLCMLYRLQAGRVSCEGCPIRDLTGSPGCQGTPYEDYMVNQSIENAEVELAFLEDVRGSD